MIQKRFDMHSIKNSKCKMNKIINQKAKNCQSLLLHGKIEDSKRISEKSKYYFKSF